MFILFVFLVCMNLLMIRTDENIITIDIKEGGQQNTCVVPRNVTLVAGSNFTLQVRSVYFIKDSFWEHTRRNLPQTPSNLLNLDNSKYSITYERTISSTGTKYNILKYTYSHTRKADVYSKGTWEFSFVLLTNYDPWSSSDNQNFRTNISRCDTFVKISGSTVSTFHIVKRNESVPDTNSPGRGDLLIILVSVFGILLLVQSSFIIYVKFRSCKSNRNNDEDPISPNSPKVKRGAKPARNIADRPPLPLPPDEVLKDEPRPPPMSPVPKRHHIFAPPTAPPIPVENPYSHPGPAMSFAPTQPYRNQADTSDDGVKSPVFARTKMEGPLVPKQSFRNKPFDSPDEELMSPGISRKPMKGHLVPKQSYRNKALDHSDEELRSPGFPRRQEGPLIRKQSYTNKALENSEEELRTPNFARKQIEAKLAQLPPKGVPASKPFKLPKPLPRNSSPSPPPEKVTPLHLAQRKDPAPPLHPKKLPVFPLPASGRQPDPRLSDDEWQYEQLQPACKYLDNFSNIPYDNM